MIRFVFCASLMLLASSAFADSATQTDWSGGPGVWGPAASFGDEFYAETDIEFGSALGGLALDLIDQAVFHDIAGSFAGASCARASDIDLDGDMDIVGCAYDYDRVSWFENLDGEGLIWEEHVVEYVFGYAMSVCPADIDGDGWVDIVACRAHDGYGVVWYENPAGSGTQWVEHNVDYDASFQVYSEDIDGDGDMDILRATTNISGIPPGLVWWENLDGTGASWAEHVIDSDTYGFCVHSEDIDGDGDMDVISNKEANQVAWWENLDGTGTAWTGRIVADGFGDCRGVQSDDVDGDGDMDIIGAANATGSPYDISWWENAQGSGSSWVWHIVDGDFLGAYSVDTADMDEDGDVDILGASQYESEISWWENLDGSGTSWRKHLINGGFSMAQSVCAEDVNGDGILDIIGASWGAGRIAWWDVLTYPPEGRLTSSVLYVSCDPDWGALTWSADAPVGTSVAFQIRASDDFTQMGEWSDTLIAPCSLHGILADNASYVQYQVLLATSDVDKTPALSSVTITWDPLGLEEEPGPTGFSLLPVRPNPCAGTVEIEFCIPEASTVSLAICDVSGRLVDVVSSAGYLAGYHSMAIEDLPSGVYICRMVAGELEAVQRFVVIE